MISGQVILNKNKPTDNICGFFRFFVGHLLQIQRIKNKGDYMRFATYLPYDWKETKRCFVDYCSEYIGRESIYCISADTLEDFVLGSICAEPVCPEQLIFFEVKRFYWVDKIPHYLSLRSQEGLNVMDSNKMVEMLSTKDGVTHPYQEFTNWYHNILDKTKLEFLVPKDRIVPIKVIDIKKTIDEFFVREDVEHWEEYKKQFINEEIDRYYNRDDLPEDLSYERCLRNLEALVCFQNFITNSSLMEIANEIYGTQAIYGNMDKEIFWKLHNKLNQQPSEQRLTKLLNYVKQFICYE